MTNTQTWATFLIVYFVIVTAFLSVASYGGMFGSNVVVQSESMDEITAGSNLSSINYDTSTNVWSFGKLIRDLFSFFVFNISVYDVSSVFMEYFWLVRLVLIQLPLIMLGLTLYYSSPTVSG